MWITSLSKVSIIINNSFKLSIQYQLSIYVYIRSLVFNFIFLSNQKYYYVATRQHDDLVVLLSLQFIQGWYVQITNSSFLYKVMLNLTIIFPYAFLVLLKFTMLLADSF